jgi:hypothetical protein
MQPNLRLHATSRTTKQARVGQNRRERANPKVDPGERIYTVQEQPPTPEIQ